MGINLKNKSWSPVIADNRKHIKDCPCMTGHFQGKFCLVHGNQYTGGNTSNLKSTPAMDKFLEQQRRLGSSAQGQKFHKIDGGGPDINLLPPA